MFTHTRRALVLATLMAALALAAPAPARQDTYGTGSAQTALTYGTGSSPRTYGTGLAPSHFGFRLRPAHRPAYRLALNAANAKAARVCLFKVFASADDCLSYGATEPGRRCRSAYGERRGAWCFSAWATSKDEFVWFYTIKVSYVGETGPGGLPVTEYKAQAYNFHTA
jgi:hypothetical protein